MWWFVRWDRSGACDTCDVSCLSFIFLLIYCSKVEQHFFHVCFWECLVWGMKFALRFECVHIPKSNVLLKYWSLEASKFGGVYTYWSLEASKFGGVHISKGNVLFKLRDTGQRWVGEGAHLLMKMLASDAFLFNSGVHRSYWSLETSKFECMHVHFCGVGVHRSYWSLEASEFGSLNMSKDNVSASRLGSS